MKRYIVYTTGTLTPDGMIISCSMVPNSISAFFTLIGLGANILATNVTEEQAKQKAFQHSLAIDAYNYSSN